MEIVGSETFGQRVRRLRVQRGVRQVDLAARAGISWRHLIRIEQDAGGVTKQATVAQIAAALGVAPSELKNSDGSEDDEEAALPNLDVMLRAYVRRLVHDAQTPKPAVHMPRSRDDGLQMEGA